MHITDMKEKENYSENLGKVILSKLNELTLLSKIYFNVEEAALYVGCSKDTIRRYMYDEGLPYCKPSGGRVYILKKDLDDFLGRNRIASKAETEESANHIANQMR